VLLLLCMPTAARHYHVARNAPTHLPGNRLAAAGTKGGSSGSPVVDVRGQAVGLNAGGKNKAASAYYLPLHRVVRALRLLQACHSPGGGWAQPHIPRGDLQATFVFKGYDEVGAGFVWSLFSHYGPALELAGRFAPAKSSWARMLAIPAPQVRRLGLRQDTEAAVRASKQQPDGGGAGEWWRARLEPLLCTIQPARCPSLCCCCIERVH
jgi:hypothetical protein